MLAFVLAVVGAAATVAMTAAVGFVQGYGQSADTVRQGENLMRHSRLMIRCGGLVSAITLAIALPAAAQPPNRVTPHVAQAAPVATTGATMMRNMQTMRGQMAQLRATSDPKLRTKLLDEHMKMMQSTLQLMMANHGGCPMGGGMAAGGMMNRGAMQGGMGGGNMMQMMMDQMMQHQSAMHGSGH